MNDIAKSQESTATNSAVFDWKDVLRKLFRKRKFVALFTGVFGFLGCLVAFTSTRLYNVQVTLAPEVTGNSRAGTSLKSLTSLLGVGNLSLNTSNDALNITLFPEISSSTAFLSELFDITVHPYVSPKQLEKGVKPYEPLTFYDFMKGKHLPKSAFAQWKEEFFKKDDEKEEKEDSVVRNNYFTLEQTRIINRMRACIRVSVNKKTGVTSLNVMLPDPKVAQEVADTVCQRLQAFVTDYRTQKTDQDYRYYQKLAEEAKENMIQAQAAYAASVDYDRSVILQSVNSEKQRLQQEAMLAQEIYMQMKQQESLAKAKVQEMKPVFAIIQPAVQPVSPCNSRKKMVLLFTFFGFFCAVGWTLVGKELYQQVRTIIREA